MARLAVACGGSIPPAGHVIVAARLPGEQPRHSRRYRVLSDVLHTPRDYWHALNAVWGRPVTIINVEHDMEFSDRLVAGLLECPHPLCSYAYPVYLPTRHQWIWHAMRGGQWIGAGDEWADTSSIGFCKITPSARRAPLRETDWKWLEHSVCIATTGFSAVERSETAGRCRWHIHWPAISHYHDYDQEVIERMSDWERFCHEAGEPVEGTVPSETRDEQLYAGAKPKRLVAIRGGRVVEVSAPPERETR